MSFKNLTIEKIEIKTKSRFFPDLFPLIVLTSFLLSNQRLYYFLKCLASNCPTGTLDGSRKSGEALLKAFVVAFCRFERWSLS